MAQTSSSKITQPTFYTRNILPLQNRNADLKECLSSAETNWDTLGQAIIDFKPDVVILLARKMPRIYGALGWSFHGAHVVSDFALPFLAHEITIKTRIAIVDDSINQGTTLTGLCKRVLACGATAENIKIFAVGDRIESRRALEVQVDEISKETIAVAHQTLRSFTAYAYKNFSNNLGRAAGMFALPYEIEFPIFETFYVDNSLHSEQILQQVKKIFADTANIHDTSVKQSARYGLARFSLDMYPDTCNNIKIRLYLDDIKKTVAIVPMAINYKKTTKYNKLKQDLCKDLMITENKEVFPGESQKRIESFLSSLEFAYAELHKFRTVFDMHKIALRKTDISMLFGKDMAHKIMKKVEYEKFHTPSFNGKNCFNNTAKNKFSPSTFLDICFDKQKKPTEFLSSFKFYDIKTREGIFIKFFEHLSKAVQADNTQDHMGCTVKQLLNEENKDLPTKAEMEKNQYLRLRIGPTFDDMVIIFEYLWESTFEDKQLTHQKCRRLLSDMLDTSIDCGGIVPVIGKGMQRCFRKGEATTYDKNTYYAYQWLYHLDGKSVEDIPTDPAKFNKEDLSPHMQICHDVFLRQLHNVEA